MDPDGFPYSQTKRWEDRLPYINGLKPSPYFSNLIPSYPDTKIEYRGRASSKPDECVFVNCVYAVHMPKKYQKACLDLIENTSAANYKTSSMGWSRARKSKEMRLPDLRYVLLMRPLSEEIVGFMSFMLTFEDGFEVIYLYEIHLDPSLQGCGIGKQLFGLFEGAGKRAQVRKAMLTVFKANEGALRFYEKLGFEEDDFSPRPWKLRNGVVKEPDYVILSKELEKVNGDTQE